MKNTLLIALVIWASSCTSTKKNNTNNQTSMSTQNTTTQSKSFYDFSIATLDENGAINMADYKGKKILIVNVASKCGYTPQYEGLQKLYVEHGDKLQIIGFPCNQFMGQEPGGKEDIAWQNGQKMIAKFDEMKINYTYSEYPGGHSWPVWRNNLYNFAQLIFKLS